MSESLAIQEMLREALAERYGKEELPARFRAFDTICSATQDRQDAVQRLLAEGGLDVMLVIGGYNSSNTQALARICSDKLPTYHIRGPEGLVGATVHYRPAGHNSEAREAQWLPEGAVAVGLTAGASTPDNVVGEVIEKLLALRGCSAEELAPA